MKNPELDKLMAQYIEKRTKRLSLDKQSAELKSEEDMLRSLVLKEMLGRVSKGVEYVGANGKKAELKMRSEPEVFDWAELQTHIKSTGEFDLIQKRVTVTACRARWEAGKKVPGVRPVEVPEVSITVVK